MYYIYCYTLCMHSIDKNRNTQTYTLQKLAILKSSSYNNGPQYLPSTTSCKLLNVSNDGNETFDHTPRVSQRTEGTFIFEMKQMTHHLKQIIIVAEYDKRRFKQLQVPWIPSKKHWHLIIADKISFSDQIKPSESIIKYKHHSFLTRNK